MYVRACLHRLTILRLMNEFWVLSLREYQRCSTWDACHVALASGVVHAYRQMCRGHSYPVGPFWVNMLEARSISLQCPLPLRPLASVGGRNQSLSSRGRENSTAAAAVHQTTVAEGLCNQLIPSMTGNRQRIVFIWTFGFQWGHWVHYLDHPKDFQCLCGYMVVVCFLVQKMTLALLANAMQNRELFLFASTTESALWASFVPDTLIPTVDFGIKPAPCSGFRMRLATWVEIQRR